MQEVGRGRKTRDAAPALGRVAVVEAGRPARPPERADGADEGIVALVAEGSSAADLAPLAGHLAALVCVDDEPAPGITGVGEEQGLPCVLGATFDGDPPAEGSLVLVDCTRGEEGLVLVVDGGATDAADASATGRA